MAGTFSLRQGLATMTSHAKMSNSIACGHDCPELSQAKLITTSSCCVAHPNREPLLDRFLPSFSTSLMKLAALAS